MNIASTLRFNNFFRKQVWIKWVTTNVIYQLTKIKSYFDSFSTKLSKLYNYKKYNTYDEVSRNKVFNTMKNNSFFPKNFFKKKIKNLISLSFFKRIFSKKLFFSNTIMFPQENYIFLKRNTHKFHAFQHV